MDHFCEPIIYKDSSSLEDKLNSLKRNPFTDKNDIYMLEAGIAGERQVEYYLTKSNIGMYIMRDINLEIDNFKAQIDFVVVTSHHCYFIESKNYSAGIVYIDENRNFELSTRYGRTYKRRGIKSPLSQVDDQLNVFQKICYRDKENIQKIFTGLKFSEYMKTMVVFTNLDTRISNKRAPYDTKYRVLKVDNLVRQIEYDEKHYKGTKLSQEQMLQIANYVLSNNKEIVLEKVPPIVEYISNTIGGTRKRYIHLRPLLRMFCIALLLCYLICGYLKNGNNSNKTSSNNSSRSTYSNYNTNSSGSTYSNYNTNSNRNSSLIGTLSDEDILAIEKLKEAYNASKELGFSLYSHDYCMKLRIPNYSICSGTPVKVDFNENTLEICKSSICYRVTYDLEKRFIQNVYSTLGNYQGVEVGLINYDSSNQFLEKIGGYDKLVEMARIAHNDQTGFENYFDFSHISERGGNPSLANTYKSTVESYFRTLVGKGGNDDNTLSDFKTMIEYYYYIMK